MLSEKKHLKELPNKKSKCFLCCSNQYEESLRRREVLTAAEVSSSAYYTNDKQDVSIVELIRGRKITSLGVLHLLIKAAV
jgi:hypothetical protein